VLDNNMIFQKGFYFLLRRLGFWGEFEGMSLAKKMRKESCNGSWL
jgi:hypothetical protein